MSVNGMYIANIKFPIFPDVGLKAITVGHVRNVNILTWLQRRLSGQISIFGGVFYTLKSLLGIVRQKKL